MDDLTQARHDLAALQARYDIDVARLEQDLTSAIRERQVTQRQSLFSQATFGSFDGCTSVTGVVVGLVAHAGGAIVHAAVGLAVASTIGMALGEWMGDADSDLTAAAVMGLATAAGTLIPIIPFTFLAKTTAIIVAAVLVAVIGFAIGVVRRKGLAGFVQTYLVLVAAIGVTVGVSALIPGASG